MQQNKLLTGKALGIFVGVLLFLALGAGAFVFTRHPPTGEKQKTQKATATTVQLSSATITEDISNSSVSQRGAVEGKTAQFKSVENRAIPVHIFGAGAETVLLIGGIHGDEGKGVEVAQALLKSLQSTPAASLTRRIVIIPTANPDGMAKSTRGNAHGIDINRNFPTADFGTGDQSGRYNGGKSAASEPETKAIMDIVEKYQPSVIYSLHAPLACINYDGPAEDIARTLANASKLPLKADIGYATPGSFGTYYGREKKLSVITVELSTSSATQQRVETALLAALGISGTPVKSDKVKKKISELPTPIVEASAESEDATPESSDNADNLLDDSADNTITEIKVSKSQNLLRAYHGDKLIISYPVATGVSNCTPVGTYKIVSKATNPGNPDLGTRWLAINKKNSRTGRQYGLHGTNEPDTIGYQLSHGCVRLYNEDVEALYRITPVGARVIITNDDFSA